MGCDLAKACIVHLQWWCFFQNSNSNECSANLKRTFISFYSVAMSAAFTFTFYFLFNFFRCFSTILGHLKPFKHWHFNCILKNPFFWEKKGIKDVRKMRNTYHWSRCYFDLFNSCDLHSQVHSCEVRWNKFDAPMRTLGIFFLIYLFIFASA